MPWNDQNGGEGGPWGSGGSGGGNNNNGSPWGRPSGGNQQGSDLEDQIRKVQDRFKGRFGGGNGGGSGSGGHVSAVISEHCESSLHDGFLFRNPSQHLICLAL